MTNKKKSKAGAIVALAVFLAATCLVAHYLYTSYVQVDVTDIRGKALLELKKQNEDLVGWIEIKGTDIDYPVMQGDEYLHMNFNKEYSFPGLPFVTDRWEYDTTNTLIYGHNMWIGGMFHDLQNYLDEEYYSEHREIMFYCICGEEGSFYVEARKYEPFATVETHVAKWPYQNYAYRKNTDKFPRYISECKEKAEYETNITPKAENLLTLSTCSHRNYGKKGRVVVVSDFVNLEDNKVK